MAVKRESRLMPRVTPKNNMHSLKPKPEFSFHDQRWGKDMNTPMSRIKAQASNRKRPITLPKINLPE